MKNILAHIKQNNFKPVYLLCGTEDYLKRMFRDKLKNAILQDDDTMNYSYFEGKQVSTEEIAETVQTMPFFAERRLVVVENSQFFKAADDTITELVKRVPDTAVLVFVENEIDKRNRLYKAVKDTGYICELNEQSDSDITSWIQSILKKENKTAGIQTIQALLQKTGTSMEHISREIEKLVCYTMGRQEITAADVEEVCTVQVSSRIFDMITAMSQRKQDKALSLYYDLLTLKEPPMKILALITRNFNQLLMVKELTGSGAGSGEIAKKVGVAPFIVGKLQAQARAFAKEKLREAVEECISSEEAFKTGRINDQLVVEMLIVKYSRAA